jgi:hypothetical protein
MYSVSDTLTDRKSEGRAFRFARSNFIRDTGRMLFEELNARYKEARYMVRASDGLRQGDWRLSKGSRVDRKGRPLPTARWQSAG